MDDLNRKNLISYISTQLKIKVKNVTFPPQGMDSEVFFINDNQNKTYVVKVGEGTLADIEAYNLIKNSSVDIPIPEIYLSTEYEGNSILLMQKIDSPLLESVQSKEIGLYIPSMINTLNSLHAVKSSRSGYLTNKAELRSWKEFHLSKFDGSDDYLQWEDITTRDSLDAKLILRSVKRYMKEFENAYIPLDEYCLLHTDYNQRNLFVGIKSKEISAIIDWGEAVYGDPVYDFARVRMLIWHFDLGDEMVEEYYRLMNYSKEQKKLDDLYWISRIIEYLAYYSEKLDDFNSSRIKLHQEYLRQLGW